MVTGELTVRDAVADVSPGGMLASFLVFTLVLTTLAVVDGVLMARFARLGPDAGLFGDPDLPPDADGYPDRPEDGRRKPPVDVRPSY